MGFKDFCKKLAWKIKHGLIKENDIQGIINLQKECGIRGRPRGGKGAFAAPKRMAKGRSNSVFKSMLTDKMKETRKRRADKQIASIAVITEIAGFEVKQAFQEGHYDPPRPL